MAKNKNKHHEATTQTAQENATPGCPYHEAQSPVAEAVEGAAQKAAETVGAAAERVETAAETTASTVAEKVAEATGRVEAVAETAAGKVAEKVAEVTARAEAVAERAAETVESVAQKASEKVAEAAEAAKAEAARAETVVSETAGQVATFVKGRLEQAQRQLTQLEEEAQKTLTTWVSRGRELPAVQNLRERATWAGGEVRLRLTDLRGRMVKVVGGVASQSQVDALNRELDRISSKLDAFVASPKAAASDP